jgi:hypothetical protein
MDFHSLSVTTCGVTADVGGTPPKYLEDRDVLFLLILHVRILKNFSEAADKRTFICRI